MVSPGVTASPCLDSQVRVGLGALASGWAETGPKPSPCRGVMGGPPGGEAGPLTAACPPASPSAVSSILGTWLDQYSEDFCQPPDFPCLKQLVAYVQLNMPGSDLERRAHLLLAQLEHMELSEAELEGEKNGRDQGHTGRRSPQRLALGQEERLASARHLVDCICGRRPGLRPL